MLAIGQIPFMLFFHVRQSKCPHCIKIPNVMNAHTKVWFLRSKVWYAHSKLINENGTIPLRAILHFLSPYPRLRVGVCLIVLDTKQKNHPLL